MTNKQNFRSKKNTSSSMTHVSVQNSTINSQIKSYFSHSVFLPNLKHIDQREKEAIHVIGHYTIENIGDRPLNNLFICLRMSPCEHILLSGKIELTDQHEKVPPVEDWVYIQDGLKSLVNTKGEHWLRPLHFKQLLPGEKQSFSNFTFTLHPNENVSHFLVEGVVFSKEVRQGVSAVNTISVFNP
ncbi:hypothetical protein LGQ02_13875 [Bacillus shivajii]|uniref:hypothetical protein n=1 Tax=Bacillus shivajii TaxID=1983719 RepID=UPI001CFB0291|nr:hypothetical protein [Bacillus shivajii]UCZ51939.1 hypothetical protein LGQ02_13875 [Bacillus shivajii]